jgi:hypothetical protein
VPAIQCNLGIQCDSSGNAHDEEAQLSQTGNGPLPLPNCRLFVDQSVRRISVKPSTSGQLAMDRMYAKS